MLFFPSDRVISRAPGLKLVVETLITSLKPIGNIVLICCAFFIIFGILGVQVKMLSETSCPCILRRQCATSDASEEDFVCNFLKESLYL